MRLALRFRQRSIENGSQLVHDRTICCTTAAIVVVVAAAAAAAITNVKLIVESLILFVILLMTVWRKGKKAKKANRIYQSGGFLFSCAPLKILEARVHCKLDNQNEIAFSETKWNAGLLRFTFLSYIKSPFIHNPRQTTDKHNTYDHR